MRLAPTMIGGPQVMSAAPPPSTISAQLDAIRADPDVGHRATGRPASRTA